MLLHMVLHVVQPSLSLYEMPERFYRYMVCGVHASY